MNKMNKKVLIAMSGGVDSSVAAYLSKKAGYKCVGATIKTWPRGECERTGDKMCCSIDAISSARSAAHALGIPHYVFDLSKKFMKDIREYFIGEYKSGHTPNPCVYCNSEIKFGALWRRANELDCDYISSGHYARASFDKKSGRFLLKKGLDDGKDQSYFLFNLRQEQLKHILFPLGSLTKEKVRSLAKDAGLKSYDRASSQDVCFDVPREGKKGKIIFRDGHVIGEHDGITQYTVGQRKGLGVAYTEPLYVTRIDPEANAVHVGTRPDTLKRMLIADKLNWIQKVSLSKPIRLRAKIRYGSEAALAKVASLPRGKVRVEFDKPQYSPTIGQAVVFYKKDTVIGGGWIKEVGSR